jgi:hypothetical protein
MKTIYLSRENPTLLDVLALADKDNVILRTEEGREFVLAEVNDFSREVELVRQHQELMEFLGQRSRVTKTYTLKEARQGLDLQ